MHGSGRAMVHASCECAVSRETHGLCNAIELARKHARRLRAGDYSPEATNTDQRGGGSLSERERETNLGILESTFQTGSGDDDILG